MKKYYFLLFLLIPVALNSVSAWEKDRIKFIEEFVKNNYKFPDESCIEINVDNCQDGKFHDFNVNIHGDRNRFSEIAAKFYINFPTGTIFFNSSDNDCSFQEDLKRILESYRHMEIYDFNRSVNDFLKKKNAEYPLFPEGMVEIRVIQYKEKVNNEEMNGLSFYYKNVDVFGKKIKKWFLWKTLGERFENYNLIELCFHIDPFSKDDLRMSWAFSFKKKGKKNDYLCIDLEPIKGQIVSVDYACLPRE